jgi:hypothetical protein
MSAAENARWALNLMAFLFEAAKHFANAPTVSVDSDHEPLDRMIANVVRRQRNSTCSIYGRNVAINPK